MGKIVIETNKETGLDDVELTLDNGQVLKFSGVGQSELRHVRPKPETVNVGDTDGIGVHEYVTGMAGAPYWHFSLTVDRIPEIDMEDPT